MYYGYENSSLWIIQKEVSEERCVVVRSVDELAVVLSLCVVHFLLAFERSQRSLGDQRRIVMLATRGIQSSCFVRRIESFL